MNTTNQNIARACDSVGEVCTMSAVRAGASEAVAPVANEQAVFAIIYDDHERQREIVVGQAAAEARFKRISVSWNAHLFGKIKSNSRDDRYASNNVTLAAPTGGESDGAVDELVRALKAVQKIFDKSVTFVGGGPTSTVVVPFESHDQSWNHWHEARDIIRAALQSVKPQGGAQ